jgi:hypothetical protein
MKTCCKCRKKTFNTGTNDKEKSNQNIPVGKKRHKSTRLKGRHNYITGINKCEGGRLVASAFPSIPET